MNAIAHPEKISIENNVTEAANLNSLVVELEHYRRQSEWLSCVNDLHGRLAGAVDLTAMIEAFSIWLMPLVNHDLIAYQNIERQRVHMFCSCHGPERRQVMQVAGEIFKDWDVATNKVQFSSDDFHVYNWQTDDRTGGIRIIVLRKFKEINDTESHMVDKGLRILKEPLQRALEYEDLYDQASRDSLTGLANRRVFEERIDSVLGSAERHGHPVTLACMDLDRFKQINDTYGHMVGDLVLQKVAKTMESMVRSCDLLVRMGGDEFILVMSSTNLAEAQILANRLCRTIEQMELPVVGARQIGISIGLYEWQPKMTKDSWIQQADEALYKAKESGRSRVCVL